MAHKSAKNAQNVQNLQLHIKKVSKYEIMTQILQLFFYILAYD